MKTPLRILYLEDDPTDAELVLETLEGDGIECEITRVETETDFVAALEQGGIDLVLADYTLPSFDGLSALEIVQRKWPQVPLIFVSGTLGEELAIEALKRGATDYVVKTRLPRIVPSVQRALREAGERRDLARAEEALRLSEAYLAEAQRISHVGSFGWDVATGKLYWSQETFRILGYDPLSRPSLDLVLERTHPEDRAMVRLVLDRAARENTDFDFEHRLLLPDGSLKYLRVVGSSAKSKSSRFEYVGAVSDITERKLSEEALQKVQAELAHVTRVTTLGELTASIAHEINQPLTAVASNASAGLRWLSGDLPNLEEAREALRRMVRDSNRASEVIARVRALFKKTPMTGEQFDINEAIEEIVMLAQGEAQRSGILILTALADNVPVVLGDRVQLQQVVLNLLLNAIDAIRATSQGRREILVSTRGETCDEPGHISVTVKDSGHGLDPQTLNQLFTAFYTTKPKGLGIGLAVSRSIIEAHGGRLEGFPNQGPGATFRFTLPIRTVETEPARART